MVSCFNLLFFFPMFLCNPLSLSLSLSNGQSLSSPRRNALSVSNNPWSPGVERSLSPFASHLSIDRSPTEFLLKRFECSSRERRTIVSLSLFTLSRRVVPILKSFLSNRNARGGKRIICCWGGGREEDEMYVSPRWWIGSKESLSGSIGVWKGLEFDTISILPPCFEARTSLGAHSSLESVAGKYSPFFVWTSLAGISQRDSISRVDDPFYEK